MSIQMEAVPLKLGGTFVEDMFIDDFMPGASEKEIKVYLLGLRLIKEGRSFTMETIGSHLDITVGQVLEAYEYWEDLGIVRIDKKDPTKPVISYIPIMYQFISSNFERKELAKDTTGLRYEGLMEKINGYLSPLPLLKTERIQLVEFLHYQEVDTAVIIEAYTITKNYKNRTREAIKLLTQWASNNLKTVEEIRAYRDKYNLRQQQYARILKALGKPYSNVTLGEKESIDHWLDDLHLSMEQILDTIADVTKRTTSVNMNYLNKVFDPQTSQEEETKAIDYDSIFRT